VHINLSKVLGAVTYYIQACQGDPNDEAAWNMEWLFTRIRGGVEITGLEPGDAAVCTTSGEFAVVTTSADSLVWHETYILIGVPLICLNCGTRPPARAFPW
jgi:hypothetical protein